ncbi:uncharacterized protein LOC133837324 isoform X3 [Drosophila sulfurigaster albostrigata]|uniref:uncharacterized protein LOC133837324 isoform X3 n=1 Tax=Drosophila sulfurigaster albostrigata TaxID=89887 RepID=UPI002D2199B2|nr:uncharacterized protein LOC133837324 isoform X3 [Drosophila sulfurigaster albostrigata]
MANISSRLARSINAFRRIRCSLPATLRHFHERNNGSGIDDGLKKQQQNKNKLDTRKEKASGESSNKFLSTSDKSAESTNKQREETIPSCKSNIKVMKSSSTSKPSKIHCCEKTSSSGSFGKVGQNYCGVEATAMTADKSVNSVDSHVSATKAGRSHTSIKSGTISNTGSDKKTQDNKAILVESITKAGKSNSSIQHGKLAPKNSDKKCKNSELVLAQTKSVGEQDFEKKLDFTNIEKVCEENIEYIKNLLNNAKLDSKMKSIEPDVSAKEATRSSDNDYLRIPSHEDVHRASLQQQSLIHDFDSHIAGENEKSSPKPQSLRIPAHVPDHERDKNIVDNTASKKSIDLQAKPNVPLIFEKSKLKDQSKSFKITDMLSESSNETPYASFVKNSNICNTKGLKDYYYEKADSSPANDSQAENESSTITLGSTDEPYVFPTNIESGNYLDDHQDMNSLGHKHEDVEDFDVEMSDSKSDKIAKLKKSDSFDITDNNFNEMDTRSGYTSESFDDIDMDSSLSTKLNEKAEYITYPSNIPNNITGKTPLRGTVAMLLEAKSKIRAEQNLNITDNDLVCDQSTRFGGNIGEYNNTGIGTNNIVSKMNTDNSEFESKTGVSSVARPYEEEYHKTIGSQIIAEFSGNDCIENETSSSKFNAVDSVLELKKSSKRHKSSENRKKVSTKSNETYNPVDSIFELKSMPHKKYSNSAGTSGTSEKENSGTEKTVKSESNLTPGDLYNSTSECPSHDNMISNEATFKRVEFRSGKFGKVPKQYASKIRKELRNKIASKTEYNVKNRKRNLSKTGKSGENSSRIVMLNEKNADKTLKQNYTPKSKINNRSQFNSKTQIDNLGNHNDNETLQETYSKYEREIKSENRLTPGDLYTQQSEGDLYEDWETSRPNRRKIKYELDHKPSKSEYKDTATSKVEEDCKNLDTENHLNDFKSESKQKSNIQTGDDFTEIQEGDIKKVEDTKALRDKHDDEELEYAKRYLNKAKRLHDAEKKRSMDRKKRMRNSPRRKSKKSKSKMTLSEFLSKLVTSKDDSNMGGGNRRHFSTLCNVHMSILNSKNYATPKITQTKKKSDSFISPDLSKQGLGAASISQERMKYQKQRKVQESTTESHLVEFDDERIKIQGGSLNEQKHKKRVEEIKRDDEKFDTQIQGGSLRTKDKGISKEIPKRTIRKCNNWSQNIWESFRSVFPDTCKMTPKKNEGI